MNLIPYGKNNYWNNPWRDFEKAQKEIFQAFNRNLPFSFEGLDEYTAWVPAIDIDETNKEYIVAIELPGLEKNQVKVFVEDGQLVIQGEKKCDKKEKRDGFWRTERAFGKFKRVVELGNNIDPLKVQANYKNGMLTVNVPKKESSAPREIQIDIK